VQLLSAQKILPRVGRTGLGGRRGKEIKSKRLSKDHTLAQITKKKKNQKKKQRKRKKKKRKVLPLTQLWIIISCN